MKEDVSDLHAQAFEAAAAVPLETLAALYDMVIMASRQRWTYAQLRFALHEAVGSLPLADDFHWMTWMNDAVNPGDQAGPSPVCDPTDQAAAPKSWAALRTEEEAIAWVSAATEEELGEMAARLLVDRPLSRAEVVPQQAILRATLASEKLSRRVMRAAQAAAHPKRRSRRRAVDQGDQE